MPLCTKIPLRYCAHLGLNESKLASVYQSFKTSTKSLHCVKHCQVKYGFVYEIYRLYNHEDPDKVAHVLLTLLKENVSAVEVSKVRDKIIHFHKRITRCSQDRRVRFYDQEFFGEGGDINGNGFESGKDCGRTFMIFLWSFLLASCVIARCNKYKYFAEVSSESFV